MNNISKLADVRKAQGITQEQLSVLSGVSRGSIARYETGKVSPTVRVLQKLAKALRVSVAELVGRKGA